MIISYEDVKKYQEQGWRVLGFAKRYGLVGVAVWVMK